MNGRILYFKDIFLKFLNCWHIWVGAFKGYQGFYKKNVFKEINHISMDTNEFWKVYF